jgi:uncharacterized protein (TIGR00661 family)
MNSSLGTILVAPLNWGLGHATRCIPIINALVENGFTPILASDGASLELLKKEFPSLTHLTLPSYEIEYSKKAENFKWKLLKNSPKTFLAVAKEKKMIKKWIVEYAITGIISDNRLGVFSKKIPCVFITHQLRVMSGNTTWFSSSIHRYFIKKYNECWVPDAQKKPNLSGKMGHIKHHSLKLKYIGILSRMKFISLPKRYDYLLLISGPEPQRTMLQDLLLSQFYNTNKCIVMVKGIIEKEQTIEQKGNIKLYNFMTAIELEKTINESEKIIARSGYTTIMDLVALKKKAFFIPTPGQFEQEYLAKRLKHQGYIPSCKQEQFTLEKLHQIDLYKTLDMENTVPDWKELFLVFKKST